MNWYDPIAALAAVSAVTKNVRLGMNVLIAPLRPAVLLAKELATVDAISEGRVEASFGVGWQRAEYTAGGREFDGRFGMLVEQIEACRNLWSQDGATYDGSRIQFDATWSRPNPPQGKNIPIALGIGLSARNLDQISRLGAGWAPAPMPARELRESIHTLRSHSANTRTTKVTAAATLHPPRNPCGRSQRSPR